MLYLLAIVIPPLAVLLIGKPVQAVLSDSHSWVVFLGCSMPYS
jgi:hypothetical protein